MTDKNDMVSSVVNRHMARLLQNLEDADCPLIFRDAVKAELVWLRNDLTANNDRNERNDIHNIHRTS